MHFDYDSAPVRILFGAGRLGELADELGRLGWSRPMLLGTAQQVDLLDRARALLGGFDTASFDGVAMHTPVSVTQDALAKVREHEADGLISLGGGSAVGLGKAISIRTGLPHFAVPTTYAGSEMTPILGETENGRKVTQRKPAIRPDIVLYDSELTLTLPLRMSVTSGLNAIAHAVEAIYAPDANPVTSLMAEEGVRAMASALRGIVADEQDRAAREGALYAAWLCGTCLGQVSMGLHHKLCHTLGGMFDLPHAETHSIVLPHAMAYNEHAAPQMERIGRALQVSGSAATAMHELALELHAPTALRELGMAEDGISAAAEQAVSSPYPNPRPIERDAIADLLRRAWSGAAPSN